MSSTIIWNLILAIPFLLAFIAVPLWMSVRRPDRAADHTAAQRYLTAKRTPVASTAHTATVHTATVHTATVHTATAYLNAPGAPASDRELVLAGRS